MLLELWQNMKGRWWSMTFFWISSPSNLKTGPSYIALFRLVNWSTILILGMNFYNFCSPEMVSFSLYTIFWARNALDTSFCFSFVASSVVMVCCCFFCRLYMEKSSERAPRLSLLEIIDLLGCLLPWGIALPV